MWLGNMNTKTTIDTGDRKYKKKMFPVAYNQAIFDNSRQETQWISLYLRELVS